MLLAGSFTEYPFFLLQEIFHHRRETGLLEVTSPKHSGYLYVKKGEIKDGEMGKLRGAKAVEVVRNLADASFQFKPLEPTGYAQVVWEKSFGSSRPEAGTPAIRVEVFRSRLTQFLTEAEAVNEILVQAVVSLAHRAARQVRFCAQVASSCLKKASTATGRQTLAVATTSHELFRRAQIRTNLLSALRKAMTGWHVARGRIKELILKYSHLLSFRAALALIPKSGMRAPRFRAPLVLIPKSGMRLPSFREIAQSNVSFAVIEIALLIGIAVTAFYLIPSDLNRLDRVPGTDENIGIKATPQRKQVSRKRAKRKPRSNRIPQEKRDASHTQEQKFPLK